MTLIYIVFDETTNREVLRTVNRVLAYRFILKSEKTYKMYIKKERS